MLGTAYQLPRARFSKVPKTFRFRKAIRKTPTRLFCKAGLFICCEGDKNHNNCKVSCLRRDAFFLKKRQLSPEMRPKDFRETGSRKRYEIQSSDRVFFHLAVFWCSLQWNSFHRVLCDFSLSFYEVSFVIIIH